MTIDHEALTEIQKNFRRLCHETVQKVTDDMGRRQTFNTAVSSLMELLNATQAFVAQTEMDRLLIQEAIRMLLLMLSPITPHITHKLWAMLGNSEAIINQRWPTPDNLALTKSVIHWVVQVNGKLRAELTIPVTFDNQAVEHYALTHDNVKRHLEGKIVQKIIIVPNKLVNIVVR